LEGIIPVARDKIEYEHSLPSRIGWSSGGIEQNFGDLHYFCLEQPKSWMQSYLGLNTGTVPVIKHHPKQTPFEIVYGKAPPYLPGLY